MKEDGTGERKAAMNLRTATMLCVTTLALLAGCAMPGVDSHVEAPAGSGVLRYRDVITQDIDVAGDLQYGVAPGADGRPEALDLDLYEPSNDQAAARPAIIWVHGGSFAEGDKAYGPVQDLSIRFAQLGYVVVSINYRLLAASNCYGAGGVTPGCYDAAIAAVHDAQAAVRWLRASAATYRIDPERIGIGGVSAGAIVATAVGVWADNPGDSGNPGYSSAVRAWASISGGLPNGMFVDASDSPGLLFSGTSDHVVPYTWSLDTANSLAAADVPVVLQTLFGAGHVPWGDHQEQFIGQTTNFFYEYLDVEHA